MKLVQTVVIFRVWPKGNVLALFPMIREGYGLCLSYEHVGQHGAADYAGCIISTRPAKPDEYASLKSELESLGYDLVVRKRYPHARRLLKHPEGR